MRCEFCKSADNDKIENLPFPSHADYKTFHTGMWSESQTVSRLVVYLVSLFKGVPELVPLHVLECTAKTLPTTSLKKLRINIKQFH